MLAHAGHWLSSLIYVVPVLGLVGYLAWQHISDRRSGRDRDAEDNFGEASLDDVLDGKG